MSDLSTDKVIEEDKKLYSQCFYSTSSSKSCSLRNGSFVCDAITRIIRNCPREKPVEIFRKTESSDQNELPETSALFGNKGFQAELDNFDFFPSTKSLFEKFNVFSDIFRELESEFNIPPKSAPKPPGSGNSPEGSYNRPEIIAPHSKKSKAEGAETNLRGRMEGPIEKL